ncbi:16S rRNA (cytidine(1402)-2'-O)-methyltransferase [Candidatus Pelagibacter sp.]|nr:16S rRNA (cytidine(1402)-2'-O)-methyltransferase [Candidatus Pelagibacter sp.]
MIPSDQNKLLNFKSGLYVVSTPIGNLMDITLNAIEILKISDLILCEDTRVSKKLLDKHNIKSKILLPYHKFNEKKNLTKAIKLLDKKKIVSIISDAGTPCISDPGNILINECIKNQINIFSIPGPSSVISAVSISGFTDKFIFYGFFPEKTKDIKKDLELLSKLNLSIVFFISAKKFKKSSIYLEKYFSGRKILICKELTKMYEQHFRLEVSKIKDFNLDLRGEITIVISEKAEGESKYKLDEEDKLLIKKLMKKLSIKDIVSMIKKNKDIPKKEIYNYCIQIKNEN